VQQRLVSLLQKGLILEAEEVSAADGSGLQRCVLKPGVLSTLFLIPNLYPDPFHDPVDVNGMAAREISRHGLVFGYGKDYIP
jgi:hypothetical protein